MRYVSIMFSHPSIAPTPRNFAHINQSNPNTTWGGKFERQCMLATKPDKNFLIGDSHLERLSRPALSSLFQQHLSNWHNFGIGGDRVEHVAWRLQHGACPDAPGKVLLWMGTNNIKNNNSKELETIANTICNTVSFISNKFPQSKIAVIGLLPQKDPNKTRAASRINNILKFRLPSTTLYITPPFSIIGTNNILKMTFT